MYSKVYILVILKKKIFFLEHGVDAKTLFKHVYRCMRMHSKGLVDSVATHVRMSPICYHTESFNKISMQRIETLFS